MMMGSLLILLVGSNYQKLKHGATTNLAEKQVNK
jgi:hypothetical protein